MPQTFGQRYVKPPPPTEEELADRLPDPKMDPFGYALARAGLDREDEKYQHPDFRNSLSRRAASGDEEAQRIFREMQYAMFGEERTRPGYDRTVHGWERSRPGFTNQRPGETMEQYQQRVRNGAEQARTHYERMGGGGYQTPTQKRQALKEFRKQNGSKMEISNRLRMARKDYQRGISNWSKKNSGNSYRPGNMINPSTSFMDWYRSNRR